MQLAVIFDVDGVLVDSYQAHYDAWIASCAELGIPLDEETFVRTFGRTNADIFEMLAPGRFTAAEANDIGATKEQLYRDMFAAAPKLIPGGAELVESLKAAGFRVAFGSSGPPENVHFHVDLLGVGGRLDAVITGADVTRGKPDPQVFLMAAERMGVPPAECAVIEDAVAGVEAANRAGMSSIGLVGTTTRGKLSHAKLVVDSLAELTPELLRNLIERR